MMKYDLIAEAYVTLLIEGRIDDLKAQNPHLTNEINSYVNADPTPQKKFVPWLVSQHKKGNVTPDDPDLHQTLSGFETYKSRHGIRDHSSKSYQEIKDAVQPFLGTAATNKELMRDVLYKGIKTLYNDGNTSVHFIKTKEASQHVYGGGKELGGLHTGWCVSDRRDNMCVFGHYGRMYTIHVKDDVNSPYAVHPESDKITTRNNHPNEYSIDEGIKKFPHLINAINVVNSQETEKRNIDDIVRKENKNLAILALHNPLADRHTTKYAAQNVIPDVALAALNHPESDEETTWEAAMHPDPEVALAALNHPLADRHTTKYAAMHPNSDVALAALKHPEAGTNTINVAVKHKSPEVALAALKHPLSNTEITWEAAMHPDPEVALAALNHPKADKETIRYAIRHPNPIVKTEASRLLNRTKR